MFKRRAGPPAVMALLTNVFSNAGPKGRRRFVIEPMERRCLLAASAAAAPPPDVEVIGHTLYVSGTGGDDRISIALALDDDPADGQSTLTAIVKRRHGGGGAGGHGGVGGRRYDGFDTVVIDASAGHDDVTLVGLENVSNVFQFVAVHLGPGNDRFASRGFDGQLLVYGEEGDDRIDLRESLGAGTRPGRYGAGRTVSGGDGDDDIAGSDGNDLLAGDAGDDLVSGYGGDDWVIGGRGSNVLFGGEGDDNFLTWQNNSADPAVIAIAGSDLIEGGAGFDTATLAYDPAGSIGPATWSVHVTVEHVIILATDISGGGD